MNQHTHLVIKDCLYVISDIAKMLGNPEETKKLAETVFSLSQDYENKIKAASVTLSDEKRLKSEIAERENAVDALYETVKKITSENEKERFIIEADKNALTNQNTQFKAQRIEFDKKVNAFNSIVAEVEKKQADIVRREATVNEKEQSLIKREEELQTKIQALKDATRGI